MLAAQTAIVVNATRGRNYRRGPVGFSPFGSLGALDINEIAALQQSLNQFQPTALPPLVVDGIVGPKTRAKIREFQSNHGLPVTGNFDSLTMQALGFQSSGITTGAGGSGNDPTQQAIADLMRGVGQQVGTMPQRSVWQQIWDALTLKGIGQAAQNAEDVILAPGVWTVETAKAAANEATATGRDAMRWLASNGDLIAKGALGIGVAYSTMIALGVAGGGLLLVLLLKKR